MKIHLTLEEYLQLSPGQDYVPLYAKIMGDGLTPVMVYQKLQSSSPYSYLLESVQQNEKLGRFSLVGADPWLTFSSQGRNLRISDEEGKETEEEGNPFEWVMGFADSIKMAMPDGLEHFKGSLVGYFGYDCIRHIERIPDENPDDLEIPESIFMLPRRVVVFDNLYQSVTLIELAKSFGHRSLYARLRKVILPGAAPGIMGGLRAGLGMGWMTVVAAELFGITGIGQRMMEAAGLLTTEVVIVYMLTIALLYGISDAIFVFVRNRLLQWQR